MTLFTSHKMAVSVTVVVETNWLWYIFCRWNCRWPLQYDCMIWVFRFWHLNRFHDMGWNIKNILCPALRVEKGPFFAILALLPYFNNEEREHPNSSASFRSPEGLQPAWYLSIFDWKSVKNISIFDTEQDVMPPFLEHKNWHYFGILAKKWSSTWFKMK